jgi:SAM-dependent methyltransferase
MRQSSLSPPAQHLDYLPYFISWGGEAAVALARAAFNEFLGTDLSGMYVIEIGAGPGKMSSLFGLLGAEVIGLDIELGFAGKATHEARKWGVADRVHFREYNGSLAVVPDSAFDVVFTKSVLPYIDDLECFMRELAIKLKPDGRVCFLENPCRNQLDAWIRTLAHTCRGRRHYHYMNHQRIAAIGRVFDLEIVRLRMNPFYQSCTPGWYLICGRKRPDPFTNLPVKHFTV